MRAKRRSEGTEWGGTSRANADKGIAILVAQPIRPYGPYGCTETYANSSMQGGWSPGRYGGLLARRRRVGILEIWAGVTCSAPIPACSYGARVSGSCVA